MKPIVIILCLLLSGCFGTELIRISGIGIKTGDLITVPHKIETLTKDKNDKQTPTSNKEVIKSIP
jgi:hypothetical protein